MTISQSFELKSLARQSFLFLFLATIIGVSTPSALHAQSAEAELAAVEEAAAPVEETADSEISELDRIKNGKTLFTNKCASCHHPKVKMTGPAMEGARERWIEAGDYDGLTGEEWLYKWIRNTQDVLDAGYPYAVSLYNEYQQAAMNANVALTDAEIEDILLYADKSDMLKPAVTLSAEDQGEEASGIPVKTVMIVIVLILFAIYFILNRVSGVLDRMILEKEGQPVPVSIPFWKSKKLVTALALVVVIFVGYTTADNAINLGRQQGYMPAQPIKFSHELHAGKWSIDCQYCHSTAAKGKHSNIPSANVCMNCHKQVKEGPKYGTEEIAKIYDAVGWDPEEQKYTGEPKPIEWVRIHNLPDHVYFNHAQHVTAGGVECQTCHGPVEEMEELYQFAPLSMGWCVNCHRNTEVQFTSNEYYSIYEKYHEQLKDGSIDKVTVDKIGGTDCQKCHY